MIRKVWNVLLIVILILVAVWLLLFASNRSLADQRQAADTTPGSEVGTTLTTEEIPAVTTIP